MAKPDKAGQYDPYYRTPRLFGRYVYDLGGESVNVEDGINQLGGSHLADNITFTFGKFGIPDIFDTNIYAHDPKNDFFNWSIDKSEVSIMALNFGAILMAARWSGLRIGGHCAPVFSICLVSPTPSGCK